MKLKTVFTFNNPTKFDDVENEKWMYFDVDLNLSNASQHSLVFERIEVAYIYHGLIE